MQKGIDVSFWQEDIDWQKAKEQGVVFAYIKATQGSSLDGCLIKNWRNAKSEVYRGAYHFYDYRHPMQTQTNYFIGTMENDWGELPPALDVENIYEKVKLLDPKTEQYVTKNVLVVPPKPEVLRANILLWLETVQQASKKIPALYINLDYLHHRLELKMGHDILDYHLWISYPAPRPPDVRPYTDWTFWQYTWQGDGLGHGMSSKSLDMNWFNGGLEELLELCELAPEPVTMETRMERAERLMREHGWM